MRLRLVPSLFFMSAWSWAADLTPAPAPIPVPAVIEVRLADGKDLLARWDKTPWAKMWADPALKPLHKPFDESQVEAAKHLGSTPLELLAAMTNAVLMVHAAPATYAGKQALPLSVQAGADFAALAAKLFTFLKESGNTTQESIPATVAGADEAISDVKQPAAVLARFANGIAFGFQTPPLPPLPRTPTRDELFAHIDIAGLLDVLAATMPTGREHEAIMQSKKQFAELKITEASYHLHIVPEGFLEDLDMGAFKPIGYQAVDRTLLARLPATVLMVGAVGYDGVAAWKLQRGNLLASWAQFVGTDAADSDATEKAINDRLKEFGINASLNEIFAGLTGTSFIAVTPSMPFPALTVALPRSGVADKLIAFGLSKLGTQPPVEGASIVIPIPNAPVAVTLVCDKSSWLVSSDAVLADQWLTGSVNNGWNDTPAGKLALSKAPADAYLIGASDTPAVVRLLAGYAGMGLTMAKKLTPEQRQAILQGLNVLAANAATGYAIAGTVNGRQTTEIRSLTGVVPGVFIIGGIAGGIAYMRQQAVHDQPGLENADPEAVIDPNEPVTVLRQRILPAEEQFKSGLYRDQDADGVGEYGLLSELTGRRDVGEGQRLALISGPLGRGATVGGYSYTIYLPGGTTRVADDGKTETRATVQANSEAQETSFVAYAWPAHNKEGMMYALVNDVVYQSTYSGMPPAWNAVFGGGSFEAKPVWKMVSDSSRKPDLSPAAPEPANVP